jgi:nickel-dependent lactate racemase
MNLIQAHKALDMAAEACSDGGTIILVAECMDGFGRSDFLKWFKCESSNELERVLTENFEVNGQTAWSLLVKTERYRVILVSSLDDDAVLQMRMIPARTIDDALVQTSASASGYIMPRGASLLPVV